MDKGICNVLLGLCFYLLAQQGNISLEKVLTEKEDILKNETSNGVKVNDAMEDNKDKAPEVRNPGHGWELDSKVLDPDSVIGHLAESFVDVYNGTEYKAEGVDPSKSKIQHALESEVLKPEHEQKLELGINDGLAPNKRQFMINMTPWRYGIVPYEISSAFSSDQKKIIERAVKEMNAKTCVKFEKRNSKHASRLGHPGYIAFISDTGCWSYVGRVKDGKQNLSLKKPGCVYIAAALHEMYHTIGMHHEQSRSDRDKYITILWENISKKRKSIFDTRDTHNLNPYDAESVMQYGLWSFSANYKKTMSLKDERLNFLPNTADGMTFYDVKDINAFYNCTEKCKYKPVCENDGFVDHKCKCFCPDVTAGPRCQYPATDKGCGGIIDVSRRNRVIKSPNYPRNYPRNLKCVWLVKAKEGHRVKMTINDLEITDNNWKRCYHWLEIRFNLPGQTGPKQYRPCKNGKCKITKGNGYKCICISGYTGINSDKRKKGGTGCKKKPCKHGKCRTAKGNGYKCICKSGYTGKHCDRRKKGNTACKKRPCKHGKCKTTKGNGYRCICKSGYTGKNCDKRKRRNKACKKKPCKHGKCKDTKGNGYRCICKSGYTGKNCDRRKKGCEKRPCKYGRCKNTKGNGYRCICKSGYTGKNCDKRKKGNTACKRKPCVHGKCKTTKGNGYRCICRSGYTGKNCDKRKKVDAVLKCTFEVWPCFMKNSKNDDFDWTFYAGRTPSVNTGPTKAHGGRIYMYAEMSSPRKEGDRAVMETRFTLPSGRYCLRMFYHMYGAKIKKLRVSYQARGVSNTELWVKSGNQGNRWYEARIDIPKATGTKIFIEAVRGKKWNSDIAIDDLELKRGSCTKIITTPQPPSTPYPFTTSKPGYVYTCNFERSTSCFLANAKGDQFDWTFQQGRTKSYRTGPSAAAEGKYYAYIEASYPRRLGDKAFFMSRVNFPSMAYCLYFQYSMYGVNIGSIQVYYKSSSGKARLWSKSGDQGDRRWRTAAMNVPAGDNIKIYIAGIRGSGFRGDAAIDNIRMVSAKCG